jgi:hypothetical protein
MPGQAGAVTSSAFLVVVGIALALEASDGPVQGFLGWDLQCRGETPRSRQLKILLVLKIHLKLGGEVVANREITRSRRQQDRLLMVALGRANRKN